MYAELTSEHHTLSGSWIFCLYSEPLCTITGKGCQKQWHGGGHRFFLSYYGVSENRSFILKDKSMYCRQLILHFTHSCSEVILPFSKFVRVCVWLCACHNKTGIVWGNEDALKFYLFFFCYDLKTKVKLSVPKTKSPLFEHSGLINDQIQQCISFQYYSSISLYFFQNQSYQF